MNFLYLFFRNSIIIKFVILLCSVQIIQLCLSCTNEFDHTSSEQPYYYIDDFEIDAHNQNIVYAVTHWSLYRSTMGGCEWEWIWENCNAVEINNYSPQTIYALGSTLFKSSNGGSSWQSLDIPDWGVLLEFNLNSIQTLYVGTSSGLYKSLDGGNSWTLGIDGQISTICVDHTNDDIVYLIRDESLYKSTDGGSTGLSVENGIIGVINTIEMDPTLSQTLYCGTSSGLFKSSDGADSWEAILSSVSIKSIDIYQENSKILYVSDLNKLHKSIDSGINWKEIEIIPQLSHPRFEIISIKIAPSNANILYVIVTGSDSDAIGNILRSENSGANWELIGSGLPQHPEPSTDTSWN
jgi:photosystem II stability/assembly factor-like uncharacterized protein